MGKGKARWYPDKPQNNRQIPCPRYEEYPSDGCYCEQGDSNDANICKGNPHNCVKTKYHRAASRSDKQVMMVCLGEDNMEDNKQEIMIRASNDTHLTKDMLTDTWYMKGLMGVYNLGLEHMHDYLEKNDKTKALTPTLWGDGYSDGELVYDMYDCPNCGKHYELDYEQYDYCPNCGQKMNWEGIE